MARPIKEGLSYFPLDTHFDEKIQALEAVFKNDGLVWIVKFWQSAYRTNDGEVSFDGYFGVIHAENSRITPEKQGEILKLCLELGLLIKKQSGKYTSNGIQKRLKEVVGYRNRWRNKAKQEVSSGVISGDNPEETGESKVNKSKGKERKVEEIKKGVTLPIIKNVIARCEEMEIIADLNIVLGANYKPTAGKSKELIRARLKEGFTTEDFKTVHRKMAAAWGLDNKMRPYLRPITLYSNKFESYLNRPGDITQLTTQQQSNLKQLAQLNKELNNDHPGI